jgi:hypothetical protein
MIDPVKGFLENIFLDTEDLILVTFRLSNIRPQQDTVLPRCRPLLPPFPPFKTLIVLNNGSVFQRLHTEHDNMSTVVRANLYNVTREGSLT